jgi:hypothetical protein
MEAVLAGSAASTALSEQLRERSRIYSPECFWSRVNQALHELNVL